MNGELINQQGDEEDIHYLIPPKLSMSHKMKLVWMVASIIACLSISLNEELTGLTVKFPMVSILIMVIITLLFMKGITENSWPWVLPWIFASFYQCYTVQYTDVQNMFHLLVYMKVVRGMWVVWMFYVIALVLRVQLTIKIAGLAFNQWYNVRLIKELLTD
ncbi:uncharacterized protein [Atheta coriaria]|uniref:uncharacterized protein n=1 Tax=Dalotia coriaria TaxID=877792 RepID=UPI0031F3F870